MRMRQNIFWRSRASFQPPFYSRLFFTSFLFLFFLRSQSTLHFFDVTTRLVFKQSHLHPPPLGQDFVLVIHILLIPNLERMTNTCSSFLSLATSLIFSFFLSFSHPPPAIAPPPPHSPTQSRHPPLFMRWQMSLSGTLPLLRDDRCRKLGPGFLSWRDWFNDFAPRLIHRKVQFEI